MYVPHRYREDDEDKIATFIKEHSFGILVTVFDGHPVATHIPLLIQKRQDRWYLSGHISKVNPQKHSLAQGEVLVIFNGPHAYISPRWYTELNVPTWNYIAVHAYGDLRIIDGAELHDQLARMVNFYEQPHPHPITIADIPTHTYNHDVGGIVAFEIEVSRFQAAYKLSQNRNEASYNKVVDELTCSNDPSAKAVAEEMKSRKDKLFRK